MAILGDTIISGDLKVTGRINSISNPNLLINPDFKINQRGKSSYARPTDYFCVDHWAIGDNLDTSSLSVTDSYVQYSGGSSDPTNESLLHQPIEYKDYLKILGKKVTVSCYLKYISGTAYLTANFKNGYDDSSSYYMSPALQVGLNKFTMDVENSTTTRKTVGLKLIGDAVVKVVWIKLELGEAATQFIPPFYGEEILKCMRYYVRYNQATSIGMGLLTTNTEVRIPIRYPVPMYVHGSYPQIYFDNFGVFCIKNGWYDNYYGQRDAWYQCPITSASIESLDENSGTIIATLGGSLNSSSDRWSSCISRILPGGPIDSIAGGNGNNGYVAIDCEIW